MANDGVSTLPPDTAPPVSSPPDLPEEIRAALLTFLVQTVANSNIAQQNFITVNKMLDLDYMENKRSIDPKEAAGLKELDVTTAASK